jgi:glucosamine--fructose-6-phosphate aminotransferase (isomerizing)
MILSIHNPQDMTLFLLDGLQRLEKEYGQSDWVGLVSSGGVIRQASGSVEQLSTWLPNYPASFGIALSNSNVGATPHPKIRASEKLAIVFDGVLDNASSIMKDLFEAGYNLIFDIDQDIISTLLIHYLGLGLSPLEAMKLLFMRLQRRFALMALFTEPYEQLLVGSRGYPLGFGVAYDSVMMSFDLPMLKRLYHTVIKLEEGEPVLCSV